MKTVKKTERLFNHQVNKVGCIELTSLVEDSSVMEVKQPHHEMSR